MKISSLTLGLLLGGLIGFGLTKYFTSKQTKLNPTTINAKINDSLNANLKWTWSDSLDAVKAAPENHKIVYEDSNVRILQVVLGGHMVEHTHTHQWNSIMWFTKTAVPIVFYNTRADKSGKYVVSDSIVVPHLDTNIGHPSEPQGPHYIKNLSSDNITAYRLELKKAFKQ